MNVKKKETTGHQRQQDIINVARRVTMLMNTGQLEQGDVAEMTAFLLDLGVTTVKKWAACVAHVEKLIEQDWEQQVYKNIGDVAPLIVHLGESGESSSEDDNVAGEGHSRDTEVLAVPLSEGIVISDSD